MPLANVPKTKLRQVHRPRPQKAKPIAMDPVVTPQNTFCWKDEKSAFKSVFGYKPIPSVGQKDFTEKKMSVATMFFKFFIIVSIGLIYG